MNIETSICIYNPNLHSFFLETFGHYASEIPIKSRKAMYLEYGKSKIYFISKENINRVLPFKFKNFKLLWNDKNYYWVKKILKPTFNFRFSGNFSFVKIYIFIRSFLIS